MTRGGVEGQCCVSPVYPPVSSSDGRDRPGWIVMDERMTRIRELERRIADLKTRLPKHSVPPAMMIELEELEEELEKMALTAREESG